MVASRRLLPLILLAASATAQNVRVRVHGKGIVTVPMEEYVAWALAGEAGGMKSTEALKAMAVVARTYARYNLGRHAREGFDFCETTHCQDARAGAAGARLHAAAEATDGILLWSSGRPALVFYSGHCGGRSAAASELWPTARRAYLKSQEDTFCLSAGRHAWSARIALSDLASAMGLPALHHLEVASRTASGRVRTLATDSGSVSAGQLHLLLGRLKGWNFLRSLVYDVHTEGDSAVFSGSGSGHGVGLCQIGAEERGKAGHTWQQILAAYFPGLKAGVSAQDIQWQQRRTERAELWVTGAAGEESLSPLVDQSLQAVLARLNLPVPKPPQLRVYPSVAVYRDATGESGKTAAVTRGRVIHLQPVATLRSSGTLDATVRHELVHVVLGLNAKRPLPAWLDEGLADYVSGSTRYPAERARVAAAIQRLGFEPFLRQSLGL